MNTNLEPQGNVNAEVNTPATQQPCANQTANAHSEISFGAPAEQPTQQGPANFATQPQYQQPQQNAPQYQQPQYQQGNPQYQQQQPVSAKQNFQASEEYKRISKQFFYCYFFPILFFVPILPENKHLPAAKEFANTLFWLFVINVSAVVLTGIFGKVMILRSIFQFVSGLVSLTYLVFGVLSLLGKAVEIPQLEKGVFK